MREYIVTYTTFDNKTRRVKGVVLYNDETGTSILTATGTKII